MNFLKRHGLNSVPLTSGQVSEATVAELEKAEAIADRDGMALLVTKADSTIPKAWRGFEVKLGIGSYPPDAPNSHRKALYCKLLPIEPQARRLCSSQHSDFILAGVPLTSEGRVLIETVPEGPEAEEAMKLAFSSAKAQAARYLPREEPIR